MYHSVGGILTAKIYTFTDIDAYVMCGAPSANARTLGLRLNRSQGRSPRGKTGVAVSVCACADCGLIYTNPQPRPNSLDDHYAMPPEEYWSKEALEYRPEYFRKQIAMAKSLIDFREGMRALDIGVGLGHDFLSLQNAGFDVQGIEPSRVFYERTLEARKFDPAKFTCAAVEDAEFPEGHFDFVTFDAVLEHLYDPALALERAMRWTRPGGIVHLEVPNSEYLISRILNAYFTLRLTNYVTNLSPMHSPFHLYEFTARSFERHGARAGYSIASQQVEVCSILNLPRAAHPPLKWIMERRGTGMQLIFYLRRNF